MRMEMETLLEVKDVSSHTNQLERSDCHRITLDRKPLRPFFVFQMVGERRYQDRHGVSSNDVELRSVSRKIK